MLLDRLNRPERRSGLVSGTANPASWLLSLLGGDSESYSGKRVTPDSALGLVPVYSAVTTIAGDTGSLPLMVYKRLEPKGRERARSHRTWAMLHEQPNDLMAADAFWECVMAHLLLWGESFAAKERGRNGLVEKLWPIRPDEVIVEREKDGKRRLRYKVGGRTYYQRDILHLRGLSLDGVRGVSPISVARHMIGNGLSLEEFQGRFWTQGARPSGVLTHKDELSDKAAKRLAKRWQAAHGGLANMARVAILEEGMEWQSLGMPMADAQFIEQAKWSRSDVALLYRLPAWKLNAEAGASMRYENAEAASLDYVKFCLRYWLRRIEGSLMADPDIFTQGSRFYPEFLVDALLRGDTTGRAAYYTKALNPKVGWMRREEVRELENLNPETEEQLAELEPEPAPSNDPQGGGDDT